MKRVILSGKMWEVQHLLKVYGKRYTYVSEWINDIKAGEEHISVEKNTAIIYTFPKNTVSREN